MSGWIYIKSGIVSDSQIGPLSDADLLRLAYNGEISLETNLTHPVNTKGRWVQAGQIQGIKKKIEEGKSERAAKKEQEKSARDAAREAQRIAAIESASSQETGTISKFIADGQSRSVVEKIWEKVSKITVDKEEIQYIAIQAKPLVIAPDAFVVTNRRFICVRQTMLGSMSFRDFFWLDLGNASIREGMMFAEFSISSISGEVLSMDYLPKEQARTIYRIAQSREEEMRDVRRARKIEETRAGAQNIVVNSPSSQQESPAQPKDDSVEKLTKLKKMLDAELITPEEYNETKQRILSTM